MNSIATRYGLTPQKVRDLVKTTISGDLHPTVKKRLSDIVGPLQIY